MYQVELPGFELLPGLEIVFQLGSGSVVVAAVPVEAAGAPVPPVVVVVVAAAVVAEAVEAPVPAVVVEAVVAAVPVVIVLVSMVVRLSVLSMRLCSSIEAQPGLAH